MAPCRKLRGADHARSAWATETHPRPKVEKKQGARFTHPTDGCDGELLQPQTKMINRGDLNRLVSKSQLRTPGNSQGSLKLTSHSAAQTE